MSTIVKGNTPISTFKILWRVVISHAGFYQCRRCGQSKSAEEPWSPLLHRGPLRNSPATMTVLLYSLRQHLAYYTHTLTSLSNSNFDLPETNTWGWVLLAERLWQRWPLKAWGPHSFLVEDADSQSVSQAIAIAVTDLTEVTFAHVSMVVYCRFQAQRSSLALQPH